MINLLKETPGISDFCRAKALIGAIGIGVLGITTANAQPHYISFNLGTFGGTSAEPVGINNSGQIAVNVSDRNTGTSYAVLYSHGAVSNLGTQATVCGLNNLGQAVGFLTFPNNIHHAFLYSDGTMTDLGYTYYSGEAEAINDSGLIVGHSFDTNGGQSYFCTGGQWQKLPLLPGCDRSSPSSINNLGNVAGLNYAAGSGGFGEAYFYSGGAILNLGLPIPFSFTMSDDLRLTSINNRNQIVGSYTQEPSTGDSELHGFLYSGGTIIDLGSVHPECINDSGQIVGEYSAQYGYLTGFLRDGGVFYDLNNLIENGGFGVEYAYGINTLGQIVGYNGTEVILLNPTRPLEILANDGSFGMRTNGFGFNISSTIGVALSVDVSTNMANWNSVAVLTNQTGTVSFLDTASTNRPQCYYRVRQL